MGVAAGMAAMVRMRRASSQARRASEARPEIGDEGRADSRFGVENPVGRASAGAGRAFARAGFALMAEPHG